MSAKKQTIVSIICVVLSLVIGITAGFFIGKNYKSFNSNSSANSFKNDTFGFEIKDSNILKFDYSGLKEAFPYDYAHFTDFPDYLEIEFEFTNLSKNTFVPDDIIELKLFLNGEAVDFHTNFDYDWLVNACQYNINLPSKEYQVGAKTTLRKAFKVVNSDFSDDDIVEINLINKKTSELLKSFKLDINNFGIKNIGLFSDFESKKYNYRIIDGDKNG